MRPQYIEAGGEARVYLALNPCRLARMTISSDKRPRPLVLVHPRRLRRARRARRQRRPPRQDAAPRRARARYPHTLIGTSGPDVGLPPGQMGNSEVGHLNFGAGRIALMDISRIDVAVADGTLGENPVIAERRSSSAKTTDGRLHLFGLVSDGGVHSSLDAPLRAHRRRAREERARRRPRVPRRARHAAEERAAATSTQLEDAARRGKGVIGTVCGRYWAMDRDKRWDRVEQGLPRDRPRRRRRAPTTRVRRRSRRAYAARQDRRVRRAVRIGDYAGIKGDFMADFPQRPLERSARRSASPSTSGPTARASSRRCSRAGTCRRGRRAARRARQAGHAFDEPATPA